MKNIYLDEVYSPPNKRVMLVIDLRVALHNIYERYLSCKDPINIWKYFLNSVPYFIHPDLYGPNTNLIIVDDWRTGKGYNYWRESWLRKNYPEGLVYKGNRGVTCEEDRPGWYLELHEGCYQYCHQEGIPIFRQEGFEADDWAGTCWRLSDGSYQTILVTVDNDWGQLTDDKKDILLFVKGRFKIPISDLRSEYEYLTYYREREGISMTSSYDIVDYKSKFGDAGDNIAPGTPREVIDLRNPPKKTKVREIKKELYNPSFVPKKLEAMVGLQKIVKSEFNYGKKI